MNTPPVRVERRVGQRFPYLLAVSLREPATSMEGVGFTQDLSSRGVFFFTDVPLTEGAEIELTLKMPSEITLGESMPVRCRGRVLRIVRRVIQSNGSNTMDVENKIGVAVRLESYEYLAASAEVSANSARVLTLHPDHEEDRRLAHSSARPVVD